ncbi:anaerobic ribonucleoside-triphosphate reductase, partial [Thiolapillus sp.]|uniref:anaerobic ribonucleoside-triphosphate reductase n=1 Tax=Thiolapillus sp. TaxID=2017437 RepID=UPI003AF470D8
AQTIGSRSIRVTCSEEPDAGNPHVRFCEGESQQWPIYSTNGINEMIRNFSGGEQDITDDQGSRFAADFLDHIRARMVEFQETTGNMYNLEATPAEGTTYRFAKEDRKRWPDILQAGTADKPYYTNSSQLPVGYTDDPFEALEKQAPLQSKYTGGTVLHLYMSERLSSTEACKRLVKRSLEVTTHPYQHRAVPKRPFEWRPADCIPDLPWSAGNWRCGNR